MLILTLALLAGAVEPRWTFEDAYLAGGDWSIGAHNESATLAWGEAYVMSGLADMFRATGDITYLERLAEHAEAALGQRDDYRAVTDYRGVSDACWRNTSYQSGAYCYVVHSGMIATPMAEFVTLVDQHGLHDELAPSGTRMGDLATEFLAAAEQTVAAHEDQWDGVRGTYVFRPDASFLSYAGDALPLNQSTAMGRLLLALYEATANPVYASKAASMARYFDGFLIEDAGGAYLWSYWGPYNNNGEDISHAAINVDFAVRAARLGIVFDDNDLEAFSRTLLDHVMLDDATVSDRVDGGPVNTASYRAQVGRWAGLSTTNPAVWTAIYDLYARDYASASSSVLAGWGRLAATQPPSCAPYFYFVDWMDPGTGDSDFREATAYGANVLTQPPAWNEPCVVPVTVDAPRPTEVQQYDGAGYHTVARWAPTGGPALRHIPFDPELGFSYWNGGALYQFVDAFDPADPIRVQEHPGFVDPAITSTPPTVAAAGQPWSYSPTTDASDVVWWSLEAAPTGARVNPGTGEVSWTPPGPGSWDLTLVVETAYASGRQTFTLRAPESCGFVVRDDGGGTANTGTLTPLLPPSPGGAVVVSVDGLGTDGQGLLVVTAGPAVSDSFGSGRVYVDLSRELLRVLFRLTGGSGQASFQLPDIPGLAGATATLQAATPAGQGWVLTHGLEMTICP